MNKLTNSAGLTLLLAILVGGSMMGISMAKNTGKVSKPELEVPGVDKGRFEIIDSFQMFDDKKLSEGTIIQDRKNPALCFLYVKDRTMEGGTAITKVNCGT